MSIPTLFITVALVLAAVAGVMAYFAARERVLPGFREWAVAQVSGSLGLVLFALRGRAPAVVTVLIANVLLLLHPLLTARGFRRFYEAPPSRHWLAGLGLVTATAAALAWFLWIDPDLRVRVVLYGSSVAVLQVAAGLEPLASRQARSSGVQWVVSAIFWVVGAGNLGRAVYTARSASWNGFFADPTLAPMVLAAVTAQVVVACCLLYLSFDRARTDLEENEGRLRMALEAARGGTFETDLHTGRSFWSPGFFHLLGLAPGSVTPGRDAWLARIHPDDRPRMAAAVQRALNEGEDLDVEGRLESAPERWLLARGRTLPGAGGRPGRAVGIVLDVTDQKRSEEARHAIERERALAESAARFRALIEKSTDVLYVLDRERTVRFFSPGATATLGWREEEVLDRRTPELIHPDDRERLAERFQALLRQPGSSARLTFRLRHRDGSYRLLDAVIHDHLADPVLAGVVVNARDITEQQRLQEQLIEVQRLESIGQLAGGVAHDFNNMLTAILGGANGIRESLAEGTPPLPDDLQAVLDAGARAAELTGQLLAFARRQPFQPTPLDPCALVRELERLVRRLLPESIALRLDLAAEPWPVRADPGQLRQVILNLAVNARDAMPSGGPLQISVRNEPLDAAAAAAVGASPPGDFVRISVRDGGTGIPPEARAHLFEPFFTTKRLGRGTGLGLAVVHGIVKQSGGAIAVESEPGRGTVVHVYLPRCAEAAVGARPQAAPAQAGGREAVLLVEDERVVRMVAERTLRKAGYAVQAAADADEALAVSWPDGAAPDLLVTDVVMPGLDGRQLADRLRARHPGLRVLFVSGFAHDAVAHHGAVEPGVELLQKPFLGPDLLARVREVLDRPA